MIYCCINKINNSFYWTNNPKCNDSVHFKKKFCQFPFCVLQKEDWEIRPTNVGNQPLLHTSLHFTSLSVCCNCSVLAGDGLFSAFLYQNFARPLYCLALCPHRQYCPKNQRRKNLQIKKFNFWVTHRARHRLSSKIHMTSTTIAVIVKCSTGDKFTIDVDPTMVVSDFKALLSDKAKIPANQQRLIFSGHVLKDPHTLESYCMPLLLLYYNYKFHTITIKFD
jgi:hypothetical protein